MNQFSAIILCAGLGTRMGDLTKDKPKACLRAGDYSFLWNNLALMREVGVEETYINSHYLPEKIVEEVTKFNSKNNYHAKIFHEETLLETIGTVRALMGDLTNKYFYLLSAESCMNPSPLLYLQEMQKDLLEKKLGGVLLLTKKENAFEHNEEGGDFNVSNEGELIMAGSKQDREYIYTGIALFTKEYFKDLTQQKISFKEMLESNRSGDIIKGLGAAEFVGSFANLGTKERYLSWQTKI